MSVDVRLASVATRVGKSPYSGRATAAQSTHAMGSAASAAGKTRDSVTASRREGGGVAEGMGDVLVGRRAR